MKRIMTAALAAVLAASSLSGAALAKPGHEHGPPPGHEGGPPGHAYGHDKWHKGERIGHAEWVRYERVDWRRHHLRPPPRGYEWRYVDGDYVLAAMATGLIIGVIASQY